MLLQNICWYGAFLITTGCWKRSTGSPVNVFLPYRGVHAFW